MATTVARKKALSRLAYQRSKRENLGDLSKIQTIRVGNEVYTLNEVLSPNFAKGKTTQQIKQATRQAKQITTPRKNNKLAEQLKKEMITHIKNNMPKNVAQLPITFIRNADVESVINYYNDIGNSPAYVTVLFDSDLYFEITENDSTLNTYLSQKFSAFPTFDSVVQYQNDVKNYNAYIKKYKINEKPLSKKLPKSKAEKKRILKKMASVKL